MNTHDPHKRRRRRPDEIQKAQATSAARVEPESPARLCVYDRERTPHQAEILCRDRGMTDEGLAAFFGVSKGTIRVWKMKYRDFALAVKRGKYEFDNTRVESSLLRRALGSEGELRVTKRTTKDSGQGVEITETEEVVAGDVKAADLWLRNRSREWGDSDEDSTGEDFAGNRKKLETAARGDSSQVLALLVNIGALPQQLLRQTGDQPGRTSENEPGTSEVIDTEAHEVHSE